METLRNIISEKKDFAIRELEGEKFKTKGDYNVRDITLYKPKSLAETILYEDKKVFSGYLSDSAFPYAIWDEKGKALYVHNCNIEDLSQFDLVDKN